MKRIELLSGQNMDAFEMNDMEEKIVAAVDRLLENMVSMSDGHFVGALKLAIEGDLEVKLTPEAEEVISQLVSKTNNYKGLDSRLLAEKLAEVLRRENVA